MLTAACSTFFLALLFMSVMATTIVIMITAIIIMMTAIIIMVMLVMKLIMIIVRHCLDTYPKKTHQSSYCFPILDLLLTTYMYIYIYVCLCVYRYPMCKASIHCEQITDNAFFH